MTAGPLLLAAIGLAGVAGLLFPQSAKWVSVLLAIVIVLAALVEFLRGGTVLPVLTALILFSGLLGGWVISVSSLNFADPLHPRVMEIQFGTFVAFLLFVYGLTYYFLDYWSHRIFHIGWIIALIAYVAVWLFGDQANKAQNLIHVTRWTMIAGFVFVLALGLRHTFMAYRDRREIFPMSDDFDD
jgi:hypothetical protein